MHLAPEHLEHGFLHILQEAVDPLLFVDHDGSRTRATVLDLPELCYDAEDGQSDVMRAFNGTWLLLYTALHILDTVEDNDTTRAAWSRWGTGASINISTGLLAQVGLTLAGLEQVGVSSPVAHQLRRDVYTTLLRMTSGQHADLTIEEPELDQCWSMAEAKSGAFFALGCRAGIVNFSGSLRRRWQLVSYSRHENRRHCSILQRFSVSPGDYCSCGLALPSLQPQLS